MTTALLLAWMLGTGAGSGGPAAEAAYQESLALQRVDGDDALDRAIALAQEAVDRAPGEARYHHQLGTACARKAMTGTFRAFRLAGRVERAFERAVALEPRWIEARQSLLGFRLIAPRLLGGSVDRAAEQARAIERLDPLLGAMAWIAVHHARSAWPALERAAIAAAPMAVARAHRRQLVALLEGAGYPVVDDGAAGPLWLTRLPPRRPGQTSVADAWKASEASYAQALALAESPEAPPDAAASPAPERPRPAVAKVRGKGKRRAQTVKPKAEG